MSIALGIYFSFSESTNFLSNTETDRNNLIGGYYQSWSAAFASSGDKHSLSNIPSWVTFILVSFVRPDFIYTSNSLSKTGLNFLSEFLVIKNAMQVAKSKKPNQKFLLSIGGATFKNWENFNPENVIKLMNDLGADGLDLDIESDPGCLYIDTDQLKCQSDEMIISIIKNTKELLPVGKLLTAAVYSVGAYGTTKFKNSIYGPSSSFAGMWVNPLKQVGNMLDVVFIMSYDASPVYNEKEAFQAYKYLYKGELLIGGEIPPEAWGGHILTKEKFEDLAKYSMTNGGNGVFMWSFHKQDGSNNINSYLSSICILYSYSQCDELIPLN